MNIYEIKRRTSETSPYFFSRKTLKFFGQTLKDFRVYKESETTFLIIAPMYMGAKKVGFTKRIFNITNNTLKELS